MSCQRFRDAIASHAAGAELQRPAAAHLAACEPCRALLQAQRRMLAELDRELQRSLEVSASTDLASQVARRVHSAGTRQTLLHLSPRTAMWSGLAAAAALAALFVLASSAPAVQPRVERSAAAPVGPQRTAAVAVPSATMGTRAAMSAPAAAHASRRERQRPAPGRDDPPVIVDPAQARAIARLRDAAVEGRLHDGVLPAPPDPLARAELRIAPLQVNAISVPDVDIVNHPPAVPQRQ